MKGTGNFLAAAASSARPATATVRGTSKPAARSAASCSTLLISRSSTRRPLTTRRPLASSQASTPLVWSLANGWFLVCDDALILDQNTPAGGSASSSSTASPSSHCSCGTAARSKAAASGAYQSG